MWCGVCCPCVDHLNCKCRSPVSLVRKNVPVGSAEIYVTLHFRIYLAIHHEYHWSACVHVESHKFLFHWFVVREVHLDEFPIHISTIKNGPVNAVSRRKQIFCLKDFFIQNFSNKYSVFCVTQDDVDIPLIHEDRGQIGLVLKHCTKQFYKLILDIHKDRLLEFFVIDESIQSSAAFDSNFASDL